MIKNPFVIFIFLFLLPFFAKTQSEKVYFLDTSINNRWVTLNNSWCFQKGDNLEWAKRDFDDTSWKTVSNSNLNMPDGKQAIADRGEIVWFRIRLKVDTALTDAIVANINQQGASEIYLDGELIHRLGTVSRTLHQIVYFNPYSKILYLPLKMSKEQVLAIRYVNAQYKFPILSQNNGFIRLAVSTLSNATNPDAGKNKNIAELQQFKNRVYIMAGMAILICIIFLSFFFFFPSEKINGYFASCMALLVFFALGVIFSIGPTYNTFWIKFGYCTSAILYSNILLYCIYRIFDLIIDNTFRIFSFLGLITICCLFIYAPDTVTPLYTSLLISIFVIRLAIKFWHENRVAGIIFICVGFLNIIYWTIIVFNGLGLVHINFVVFSPIAIMLLPVCLAIYLGYNFGQRSQDLRITLERIRKLSIEKETILTLQNETLEKQVKERTFALNQSLEELKSTQAQLIQSEKMASLGELTAGIAHEIQNPLNFVNNFSELSVDLAKELKEEAEKADIDKALIIDLATDLSQNQEKINHHGKRASDIVKGMLEHSRKSTGEKELTDINALCDEYLRLAYHGLKAKDNSFNVTTETHLDPTLPKIAVIPQDIGRVLLNLINNAFYAVNERSKTGEKGYHPSISITTQLTDNNQIQISVKDNGSGIPVHIKDKIFQPFFTTKPTGQGTGLGLSLSYDIVKAHGGELTLESKEGIGTEFTIKLPIT